MKIALAGGGTAGHTSPLIATAQALGRAESDVDIMCIGTPKGLETSVIPASGLRLELIDPVPLPRKLNLDMFKLPVTLGKSIRQAKKLLQAHGSQVVVGFGGYVSMPVYFAAKALRLPIIVHEQNALPGVANRLAARFAKLVATTFPGTPLANAEFLGMPLRFEFTEMAQKGRSAWRDEAAAMFSLDADRPTLLVSGGSQGARRLNDATTGAMAGLLAAGVQIVHVWGPKNFTDDLVVVTDPKTNAEYHPVRFVANMEMAYAAADLMLGRCGAGTVVETAVVGLPAIFVPYPYGNGEQAKNAAALVDIGADILIPDGELTAERLLAEVKTLISDPGTLSTMSKAGQGLMPSDSADKFAQMILKNAKS